MNSIEKMPDSFLNKIEEFTGDGKNSGFIVAYVNGEGGVSIQSKVSSGLVELAIMKWLEIFLEGANGDVVEGSAGSLEEEL